jgi:hypothetical protein
MAKLSLLVGAAAGYVLGARAGRQRYAQIKRATATLWNSGPVQAQVAGAREAARTKAAPVVADFVADQARSTSERLRASKTVTAEVVEPPRNDTRSDPWLAR